MSIASAADLGALVLKAGLTAGVVVTASILAERARPVIAAAILSLPISAGPAYVVLALQHDAEFIARATVAGLPVNLSTIILVLLYAPLARAGAGVLTAYGVAMAGWLALTAATTQIAWDLWVLVATIAVFSAAGAFVARLWREAPRAPSTPRWYDVPVRATFVATLVVSVVILSAVIGPSATGLLTMLPVGYSSFILLMHGRIGGPAVAAALANGLTLLPGFSAGLVALHLSAAAGAVWTGLLLFLVVPAVWSVVVVLRTRKQS